MSGAPTPYAGKSVALATTRRDYLKTTPPHGGPIVRELEGLGCSALRVADGDPRGLECDLLILFGNCRAFRAYPALLMRHKGRRPRVVMWQIDPLPPRCIDKALEARAIRFAALFSGSRLLRPIELATGLPLYHAIAARGLGEYSGPGHAHQVDLSMARTVVETYSAIARALGEGWLDRPCMSTIGKQRFLEERGIDAGYAPFGYYADLGEDRGQPRDIDVLFIGTLKSGNRAQRLQQIIGDIAKTGARVQVVDGGVYREKRVRLLNRTRILLHIHKYPWDTPWMRWAMAAASGTLVVSEPLVDAEPFEAGTHYFEAPADDLPATIARLLADPDLCRAVATRCGEFVRREFTLRSSLQTMLSEVFGRGAAAPPS
jgi:hypothetical protein